MKNDILVKCLLAGVMGSACVLADIVVDKSSGSLSIVSEEGKTMRVKIVAPDDTVIVDTKVTGSYSWTPTGGDGSYRYDVREISAIQEIASADSAQTMTEKTSDAKSDYTGGSVNVVNGNISNGGKR